MEKNMKRLKNMDTLGEQVLFFATLTSFLLSLAADSEGMLLTGKGFFVCLLVLTLLLGGFFLWVVRNQAKQQEWDEVTERRLEKSLQCLQMIQREHR